MLKLDLEKAQESEMKMPTSVGSLKNTRVPEKHLLLLYGVRNANAAPDTLGITDIIDYAKAFDSVDHNKLENSERDGHTRPPDLPLEKLVCRSGSNS